MIQRDIDELNKDLALYKSAKVRYEAQIQTLEKKIAKLESSRQKTFFELFEMAQQAETETA